ncbi:muts domain V-domain-containing protein [Suillus subaureus]|uniref:Muts domain V-domain-containing protein n=1 Tax=Suillus subaureus TaxID=48587 RepID=A0A9P7EMK4_9AGAM|nr:muts domain V-domain-containing protein [Suillus subaureus]KAG1826176.1 muts domain V-domain-containing protein [Suillus subaureus]
MLATEILNNLAKFPHCILLTRVGQFYESYFDQAIEVARLLNIKLTSRIWDKQSIAMCGFPLMHLDKYLKVLVQHNKRFVAMCEEFPRYSASGQKPEFDRRVARVITPGTLLDEPFINQFENNYLLSISADGTTEEMDATPIGLAWIDVSTGEFFAKTSSREALKDDLARICPREVVLEDKFQANFSHPIHQLLVDEGCFVSYVTPSQGISVNDSPDTAVPPDDLDKLEGDLTSVPSAYSPEESSAITILTNFLHAHLLEHMPNLSMPSREGTVDRMQIDSHTIKALEIRESTREGGTTGSLLSVVKRTVTRSGTRLLARWLCSPSTSVKEIQARQSLVAFFHARPHLLGDVRQFLDEVEDTTRIVQRFLLGRGDPGDLVSISKTINVWSAIRKRFELEKQMESSERGFLLSEDWSSVDALLCRMADLQDLENRINLALRNIETTDESRDDQDANGSLPADAEEPGKIGSKFDIPFRCFIRPEFSSQLMSLHTNLVDLLEQRRKMERRLQVAYEAPSLTLRTSPAQGMHVHIGRSRRDQVAVKASPLFINISESGSTSSYFYQPWSSLGNQLVETATAITNAEKEAFNLLRNEASSFATHLQRNARIMDELDVTLGFAVLAAELRFTRPVITDNMAYEVTNGRHPTVELGLLTSGRVFTPNSVVLERASRLHIITGPNMAGKSTFLRQAALIAILAQTGSFVPADHAVIGVVDKLFSRVGAKDDLFRDRSTFMVEMLETAEILRRATPMSLVIMDEVGRGTTVKDGLAIAFAAVHHLVTQNQCRALFATHFHELADMLSYSNSHRGGGVFQEVGFFCTDDNHFAYSHRLRPGVNRDSHGLKVAQLAGMPESAVLLAKKALDALKGPDHIGSEQLSSLGQSLTTTR